MEGLVGVGTVPDEVLLACGRPSSVPSAWWAPSLVGRSDEEVTSLRAAADGVLTASGARDPASGRLTGVLREVAGVAADATLLLLLEIERPGGALERRSIVVAPERALLDLHGDGVHDLLLATPPAATMLLADLLAGEAVPVATAAVRALAGDRSDTEVEAVLPAAMRNSTTRILRTGTGGDDEAVAHAVTVVHHPDGLVACWALPAGGLRVQVLDDVDAVADVAVALLGAVVGVVPA